MASYRLQFLPAAKAEWDRLDGSIRQQFAKVLLRRLDNPRVPAAALTAMPECYKIKLRSTGFRLVYRVDDDVLVLLTIAVGKRERSAVYDTAKLRLTLSGGEGKGITKTKTVTSAQAPEDAPTPAPIKAVKKASIKTSPKSRPRK